MTISSEVRAKLERAQSLMRHRNVDGDLAVVLERALDLLITKLEKEKLGSTTRSPQEKAPAAATSNAATTDASAEGSSAAGRSHEGARSSPTRVTSAVRREVVRRDEERCTYVSPTGERCPARDLLELDHRRPRALGGASDTENLRILCRAHNQHAAEMMFGRAHVARAIRERRRSAGRALPIQPTLPIPTDGPPR